MDSQSIALPQANALVAPDRRVDLIASIGLGVSRYGLVFLLLLWGTFKFFAFEAEGIQPLVSNSPFLGWMYPVFGLRGTSAAIGVLEVTAALLIAIRPWQPRLSAYGSLFATVTFLTTLSFLVTTPGAISPAHPMNGFLLKDVMLLGTALSTAAEALRAARGGSTEPLRTARGGSTEPLRTARGGSTEPLRAARGGSR
jgi:reactive chlorine resistance protein C